MKAHWSSSERPTAVLEPRQLPSSQCDWSPGSQSGCLTHPAGCTHCLPYTNPSQDINEHFPNIWGSKSTANPLGILPEIPSAGNYFYITTLTLPSFFFFTNKVGEEEAITTYRRRRIPVSIITVKRD